MEQIMLEVRTGIVSVVSNEDCGLNAQAEGIVARTIEPLFDKRGRRLIIKLKTKDFEGGKNGR